MLKIETWKLAVVGILCALGFAFAAPNLLSSEAVDGLPGFLPKSQISLGLDLQGGSHLLLEVEVGVVVKERLESLVDSIRTELRKERIIYGGLGATDSAVSVTIKDPAEAQKAYDTIRQLEVGYASDLADDGVITLTLTEQSLKERRVAAVEQSIEIVRRRIDPQGIKEPTIIRQGDDRILLQVPGEDDPEKLKKLLGQTAKLTFHLLDEKGSLADAMAGRVPPGSMLVPSIDEFDNRGAARMYLLKKRVSVSGDTLVSASLGFDQSSRPAVNFRLDAVGGKKFADITRANIGKPFAIVLDGKVISAPTIQGIIPGGSGQITSGTFTTESARELSLLLSAGALPAPLTVLEERSVGPGLGQDSVDAGKVASMVGLALVVVFMAIYYGRFGVYANVALLMNMVLIVAMLSAFGATLTLPGIAGIVLTIGMAVDANVLVFERIREELRTGRGVLSAVDQGYKLALSTIMDANITTLIAAVLLFAFGSGPVQGFAVTLAVGIISSMFTAIWVTRILISTWLRRTRPATLTI
ncbi:protein translocase subunit SecD [Magnetovibrio blakemorei]|uniref:Protein translocase subunit SecD n=1 Tax=Magnetovibrio blakemorei TaxID=28181 RepID=A0A1E5QAL0_9PROT|nr:protein translocase subunit SecD [Magnetovibrio blakemorei]OEJ68881.1 protein-export membrane protein SecD [Magnetovibrio blakemorei]